MRRIKETITSLTASDDVGAVRVSRKENAPLSDERFRLILKCISQISVVAAATVLIINISIWKLLALIVFAIVFAMIYFMGKD